MKNLLLVFMGTFLIAACNNQANKSNEADKTPQTGEEWFNKAQQETDAQLQIMDYTEAIKFGPDNFPNYCSALNNRATAKKNLSDFRGALDDYNLCIEYCPGMTLSYSFRGECKMQLNDNAGAISDFDVIINSNAQDFFKASAYMNKGMCLYNLGDDDAACKNWSTAGQLGSSGAYDLIKQYCK